MFFFKLFDPKHWAYKLFHGFFTDHEPKQATGPGASHAWVPPRPPTPPPGGPRLPPPPPTRVPLDCSWGIPPTPDPAAVGKLKNTIRAVSPVVRPSRPDSPKPIVTDWNPIGPEGLSPSAFAPPIPARSPRRPAATQAHANRSGPNPFFGGIMPLEGLPRYSRTPPGVDSIDILATAGGALYHHGGPFDAASRSRNHHWESSPLAAVHYSNMEALRATPFEFIADSVQRGRPLQGTAMVPSGRPDWKGDVLLYKEGDDLNSGPFRGLVTEFFYQKGRFQRYDPPAPEPREPSEQDPRETAEQTREGLTWDTLMTGALTSPLDGDENAVPPPAQDPEMSSAAVEGAEQHPALAQQTFPLVPDFMKDFDTSMNLDLHLRNYGPFNDNRETLGTLRGRRRRLTMSRISASLQNRFQRMNRRGSFWSKSNKRARQA